MNQELIKPIRRSIACFSQWLDGHGETSYDHQSYFAGPLGGKAKALYYAVPSLGVLAVAPMIFSEAFVPSARKLFWKQQRLPIADAHYAMGYAFLAQGCAANRHYRRAVHFLNVLGKTRCPTYKNFCWGYPFDWVTSSGVIPNGTPLITTTPYAYEAFLQVYHIDKADNWLGIIRSIAEHTLQDYRDTDTGENASASSYTPHDNDRVINASAYRAFLLTSAGIHLSQDKYLRTAERNLSFVLQAQQPDGSWYYSAEGERTFIDHFHTCFVLKALAKIDRLIEHEGCRQAIDRGVDYYTRHLFDEQGLPKPFTKAPRTTVYRRELYDYAECINLATLLKGRFPELDRLLILVLDDVLTRWQKPDGSYRSRELFFGWDNVPMHRWAQSQLFRSLCFLLHQSDCN
ncbi:MAG: hypothetical protein IPP12_17000 [Nitrospira sp.]|nr:hypothetical protein [Nitrospira sp.]